MQKAPQKFFIRTYGCQMNELDTEVMSGQLLRKGLSRTEEEDQADLLIYNTCSIRDLAERKVMGKLGQLGRKKKKAIIGITGCMAMAKKEALFLKFPHLDFVLGTNNISDLSDVIDEVLYSEKQVLKTEDRYEDHLGYEIADRGDPHKAFVSIIRGCDKFCTYCVVPYTRGQEVSRSPEAIVKECQILADQGYKEITLLGQNVNSYGKDKPEWKCLFHDLLYKLDQIPGITRIRFMTSHPIDITKNLMEAIRDLSSLCNFVHFPFQAGSNRILKKMHRIYTKEQYLEKVAMLKAIVPDVALGTDVIVGFPTETEEEFQETFSLFQEVDPSVAFLYTYSPRKGTPAIRWKDDIAPDVKEKRLQRLLQLHEQLGIKHRTRMIGSTVEVLVERLNKGQQKLYGRTRCWKKVIFEGDPSMIGSEQKVKIHSFHHQTLLGNLVSSPLAICS